MKFLLTAVFVLMGLSTTALADIRQCADSSGIVTARLSEHYIGVILIRRLHEVTTDEKVIFKSVLGVLDKGGEPVQIGEDLWAEMYLGGLRLQSSGGSIELECK